jgi:hypothetical protein
VDIGKIKLFEIYYVPKEEATNRSGVGYYLSHRDVWFRRFVFNVFGDKMLYPHLEINNRNKDLFPFYVHKRNI